MTVESEIQRRHELAAPETEKPETKTVSTVATEPRTTKQQDIAQKPTPVPYKKQIPERPPVIQSRPETNPPPKELTDNKAISIDLPEMLTTQSAEQLLIYEDQLADEITDEAGATMWAFVEPDIGHDDEATVLAEPPIEFMVDEASVRAPEYITDRMEKVIAVHFEKLEPEARENALMILEDITRVIREVIEAPNDLEPDKLAVTEQKLTVLCSELFEHMGLELDEETIKWLAQNLIKDTPQIEQKPPSSDILTEEGTHEQLQADFHILSRITMLIKSSLSSLQSLGRLAVGLKLLTR